MWQVVFANVSVEGRVINSDVYGFFDGPGHILILPSTVVVWPVIYWCSKIGDGAFKCSSNSSKVLADSPMYSSLHSVLPHLNQYIMLLCFVIASLPFGIINRFFKVFPPLKCTWTPYLPQIFL